MLPLWERDLHLDRDRSAISAPMSPAFELLTVTAQRVSVPSASRVIIRLAAPAAAGPELRRHGCPAPVARFAVQVSAAHARATFAATASASSQLHANEYSPAIFALYVRATIRCFIYDSLVAWRHERGAGPFCADRDSLFLLAAELAGSTPTGACRPFCGPQCLS